MKLLRKTKLRLENRLGFTLTELMVAITVLGILAVTIVPVVMQHYNLKFVW